jgi:hypothetical protein
MALTRAEKERITDSLHKVQSISNSLKHVDPHKIRDFKGIQECLEDADRNLGEALRSSPPNFSPDAAN